MSMIQQGNSNPTIFLNTSPAISPPLAGNPVLLIDTIILYLGLSVGK